MSPATYPATRKKKPVPVRHRHILVRQNAKGQYFALPRKGKFLNGLYHFVESETRPHQGNHIGHIRQQYSHFTLEAEIWLAEEKNIAGQGWYSLSRDRWGWARTSRCDRRAHRTWLLSAALRCE